MLYPVHRSLRAARLQLHRERGAIRNLDFSSLRALFTTLLSLAVITLIGVGIRLLTQVTVQQRRERLNRQINERLRALMAAYKTLGGSFTGDLTVNPAHRRDLRRGADAVAEAVAAAAASTPAIAAAGMAAAETAASGTAALGGAAAPEAPGLDRARRVRDAVEAALSDIILLGTEEQVRLAAGAAGELAAGKAVHTAALVVSLRAYIRHALDLEPIPAGLVIPVQGPARPGAQGGRGDKAPEGKGEGGGNGGGMGGGGMGGGGGFGGGTGGGTGFGSSAHHGSENMDDEDPAHRG